jgi:6-phosphogluconate dehydrogenase (decarboxylating)
VGNANFRDQIRRAESLEARGLRFLGMGFSAVDVAFGRLLAGMVPMFVYQEIARLSKILMWQM